ncbi:MAG: translesion error-prone DNA polymerase V autoproteolytic subunit [Muribaculaceae bacterium]|nr:translesion error-prone DNA polymerase V autoproteolytic subunit [Muribaculaceae bacterium]
MKDVSIIDIFNSDVSTHAPLPYANEGIQAGFPSPAQDYINETIDLNRELIKHPAATFFGRVSGDSMIEEGIEEGDILVIDKSLEPMNGDLAVCCVDGDFTLKRILLEDDCLKLIASNKMFKPIEITADDSFYIWGIVTYTIKKNRRRRN